MWYIALLIWWPTAIVVIAGTILIDFCKEFTGAIQSVYYHACLEFFAAREGQRKILAKIRARKIRKALLKANRKKEASPEKIVLALGLLVAASLSLADFYLDGKEKAYQHALDSKYCHSQGHSENYCYNIAKGIL